MFNIITNLIRLFKTNTDLQIFYKIIKKSKKLKTYVNKKKYREYLKEIKQ